MLERIIMQQSLSMLHHKTDSNLGIATGQNYHLNCCVHSAEGHLKLAK
jgi:hypothetical protein